MSILFRLASLVRNLFRRSRVERELDADLESYVQLLADEKVRSGMRPEAARRAARVEVGGVEQVKEEVRGVLAGAWIESVVRDLRFGVRMLVKHPVLSLSVVLTFGVGIGLTTAVFTLVNGLVFRGLPVERSDRVLLLMRTDPDRGPRLSYVDGADFEDFRSQQTVFEDLAAFWARPVNLAVGNGPAERLRGGFLDHRVLDQLRVRPILGRAFGAADDRPGADPVVLIGHELWQERFGGSPDAVGGTVRVNGVTRSVIGVMPEGFGFPFSQQVWLPLALDASAASRGHGPTVRVVGRLEDGVSRRQAQTQMTTIAERLGREYPDADRGLGATLQTFTENLLGRQMHRLVLTMLLAVAGVLLIACANVANLLLASGLARGREIAVRTALGAGRLRVVRQLMSEVLVLALAGGALGLALGTLGVDWAEAALAASPPPFWVRFGVDHRVLLFVVGATVLSAVASSLVPAVRTSKTDLVGALRDGGRGTTGLRLGRLASVLVTAEVAISCALLIASGLMIRSVAQLRRVPVSIATEDVFTARLALPAESYADTASRARLSEALLPRLAAQPGVEAVALCDALPTWGYDAGEFEVEGGSYATREDFPKARKGIVSAGYFETFRAPALRGRTFGRQDRRGARPVAVVNASFARSFFPGQDAVGRRIRTGMRDTTAEWLTIVGVVPDMYMEGLGNISESPAGYYVPLSQSDAGGSLNVAIRTSRAPMSLTAGVRAAVASVDAELPIHGVMSMVGVLEEQTIFYRFFGGLFVAFGFAALFLAAVGLYGVISFSVTQRSHEMGVRLALGAVRGSLVWLVVKKAAAQLAIGLGVGAGLAALATPVLQFALFRVAPRDPVVFGFVIGAQVLVGLAAALVPASRVSRVNPAAALSAE